MPASRKNRAVFLDRDGVIIEEVDYLRRPEQLRLLSGAAQAIARLRRKGFKAVVVSNQSGVARGFLTERELRGIHRLLQSRLRARGARLDAIYYCPHHPQAGRRVKCGCRKPAIGMIKAAARRFRLDLKNSYFVGDTSTDMRTAKNAGCHGLLVRTGKGGGDGRYKAKPEAVFRDLKAAVSWIIRRER